jgi:hypothetical protein
MDRSSSVLEGLATGIGVIRGSDVRRMIRHVLSGTSLELPLSRCCFCIADDSACASISGHGPVGLRFSSE